MPLRDYKLDKNVPIPLYFQLKNMILGEIKSGTYEYGGLIPTEKELSDTFAISRTTVRQAISELVQEGWLYRVKSKGTFVSRPKINQAFIKRLETFNEQMRKAGMTPRTELISLDVVPIPEEYAHYLDLAPGDKAVSIFRRRFADEEPVVTVRTFLPYSKCAFVLERNFVEESLYEILSEKEETKVYAVTRIAEATEANAEDVQLLHIKRGKPIHYFQTVGRNSVGDPIEYSVTRYRGDRNRFEVDLFLNR